MKDLPRLDKRKNTLVTLAGRAADPLWPHPCDDDERLAVAVAWLVLLRKVGDLVRIGKGLGLRSGADFLKECVWAEADFASHCTLILAGGLASILLRGRRGIYISTALGVAHANCHDCQAQIATGSQPRRL
jgi:hypothetical protein